MKVPCEIIVWEVLPIIRNEFAKSLIKNHGLTQRKTAEILGLTEASVSRYISGKRVLPNAWRNQKNVFPVPLTEWLG